MKRYLNLLVILFALYACSSNEPEQVLQEITSPVDCISNVGWSWNDRVAKADYPYSIDDHIFSFLVKESGKMLFSYRYNHYTGRIVMKIDEFDAVDEKTYSSYTSFSLSVKKGQKVMVKGYSSEIKGIKIIGVANNSNNSDTPDNLSNPDNPQWDF